MSRERSEKGIRLVTYVQDCIQRFETGEINKLPTYHNLVTLFGYKSDGSIISLMRREGIRFDDYMPPHRFPEPSPDLAWFLGILSSAGGTINKGNIRLKNAHDNVLEKYKLIGEKLFSIDAHRMRIVNDETKHNYESSGYCFYSKRVAGFLGDLGRDSWARTILSTHPWVIDDPKYTQGFITGYFEKNGRVYAYETPHGIKNSITLATSSQDGANLLLEMLVRLGIKHPAIGYTFRPTAKVANVAIFNRKDILLLAQQVHLATSDKDKELEYFRTKLLSNGRFAPYPTRYSADRLIEEWINVSKRLDHSPTTYDIAQLREEAKKAGKAVISASTYRTRFGQGSFTRAREELERIVKERSRRRRSPEKRAQLIQFVQAGIQGIKLGDISRLPTGQALAEQFGYAGNVSVYKLLARHSIRLKDYASPYKLPEPSSDLSWFLGILSAGGSVLLNRGWICLANTHENVLEKYKLIGERLFALNANRIMAGGEKSWGGSQPGYRFNSVKAATLLGDLREDSWAETILSQHSWIVDNPRYAWGFITGYFEKRGNVYLNTTGQRIMISASSRAEANLLSEMLVKHGLDNPSIRYEFHPVERVKGVRFSNLQDVRLFSQHVHSVIPEKEAALEYYRDRFPLRGHYDHQPIYTDERLIEEWERIKDILSGNLTAWAIKKLKKEGKTEISDMTYARRFGQGSFVKAREELERIVREEN